MASPHSPDVYLEWCYAPLAPEQVRWHSYRAPYPDAKELAKTTEVPHRGSLLRFCAADSGALEAAFRLHHEELEGCWWEEEAALHWKDKGSSDGGSGSGAAAVAAAAAAAAAPGAAGAGAAAAEAPPGTDDWAYFMGGCAGDEPGVSVRSGAFEVDLRRRQLRPCYWPAACHRVLRGTWFAEKGGEWVPLKESLAEQLEEGYRQAIWLPARGRLGAQPVGGLAARLELTTHVEKGLYALFVAEEEVWLCRETGWGWLRKIGASSTAGQTRFRLRRGYEQPASRALLEKEADLRQEELDEACAAAPVSRLVLVVHGIGQKLAAANIAQDAASFRSVLRQVAADQAGLGLLDEAAAGRTEVLPVQWRKHLQLEADMLSRQLMPPGIPSLRETLHSTVVEVLLYMTPRFRAEIVNSLCASLNAAHARFMARNPGFQGSVSILAHSLGSVLCYDVLCQPPTAGQGAAAAAAPLGSPARPMATSAPPSSLRSGGSGRTAGTAGYLGGGGTGVEAMAIDVTADSPTAALQQELARLRADNQRLQLQLGMARSGGGGSGGGLGCSTEPQSPAVQQQCEGPSADYPPHLNFPVDQLVFLGSPLGCFLALRGVDAAKGVPLGSPASAALMQLTPGQAVTEDGLPAVRRLLNVYHPYDPVAHRLEPLALPAGRLQRAAFVPLFKGGKRIHLAVQEFSEDVGSAASRFGTTLFSSLAFARLKSSSRLAGQASGEVGGGSAGDEAAAAAAAAAEAAEAAAEEKAARTLAGHKSAGLLGAGSEDVEEGEAAHGAGVAPRFGALEAGPSSGALSAEASDAALAERSPSRCLLLAQQQAAAALVATGGQQGAVGGAGSAGGASASGIARVTDGVAAPGGRSAQGRLDFVMQESSLENQYLSALSAHFAYWSSADVALLVLRAVHGLDVMTGTSKAGAAGTAGAAAAGTTAGAAPAAAAAPGGGLLEQAVGGGGAERGGEGERAFEPTSPRQHLISLP